VGIEVKEAGQTKKVQVAKKALRKNWPEAWQKERPGNSKGLAETLWEE